VVVCWTAAFERNGSEWYKLVQTGTNWCKLVQTDTNCYILGRSGAVLQTSKQLHETYEVARVLKDSRVCCRIGCRWVQTTPFQRGRGQAPVYSVAFIFSTVSLCVLMLTLGSVITADARATRLSLVLSAFLWLALPYAMIFGMSTQFRWTCSFS
jgi:hypothetical protein